MSFINPMNKYFGLSSEDSDWSKRIDKLIQKGLELNPTITNKIIVDAKFDDIDQLSYEFRKQGHDIELQMSVNDTEKTFNYYCYKVLKEQTEEDAKVGNIARSWGPLKQAIRVWLKNVVGTTSDNYYRIVINDINMGSSSIFRPAITKAIKDYMPVLEEIIEKRREFQEKKEAPIFTIQETYNYTEDYEEIPANLCALDKCYFLKEYEGKKNEANFRDYIDSKKDLIEWWFKNSDYGFEFYSIKYWNTDKKAYRLFYPDWIIRFKDGRIGIFETKAGDTALPKGRGNTKDKAKTLHNKLKELGDNYVGGIAVFENGIWHYNDSEDYDYAPGKLGVDWKEFESLFI